jgi:hypothetical protein
MDNIQKTLKALEEKIEATIKKQQKQKLFEENSNAVYLKNLEAFKLYFPDLYQQIQNFKPREDFNLFVTESGHGNFIPKGQIKPLYGNNPVEQSKNQVEKYTDKAFFGRMELYRSVPAGMRVDKRIHIRYMADLVESFIESDLENEEIIGSLPKHFPTCMMFGLGLGYALSTLLEQFSFDYVFVCEPDFETFYASLFCIDWSTILHESDEQDRSVFLKVGVSFEIFLQELMSIVDSVGPSSLVSSFCYQHTPGAEVNALIEQFFENFELIQLGYGFYNDAVTGLAHTIENVNENRCPVFLPTKANKAKLNGLTAYVVANGPSLDEAIEVIKENKDNAIIFAAGTALNSLIKVGITPDFHVLVERPKLTYDYLVETVDFAYLKNLNLLTVDVMYPEVPPLYQWSGMSLKGPEAGSLFSQYEFLKSHQQLLPALASSGPLVANTALAFATAFGFEEIYLFGVDNGYPISGQTHSKLSIYNEKNRNEAFNVSADEATHMLDGNLGGKVKAISLMVQAKQKMESLIKSTPKTSFYNVGSGAKIEKAEPLYADDVLPTAGKQDKQRVVEAMKTSFFTNITFDEPEKSVGKEEFASLCDYLIEIANRPFHSRKDASDLLKAQSRVVYAYRGKKFGHLYHVIKGSMMYFYCALLSLLYFYTDEAKTLKAFAAGLVVWKNYINAMKSDYPDAWEKRCEHSLAAELQLKKSE